MSHRRTSLVRANKLPAAPRKPYPPWCWIHERPLVYKPSRWVCPEVDGLGAHCNVSCTNQEARTWHVEIRQKRNGIQKSRSWPLRFSFAALWLTRQPGLKE